MFSVISNTWALLLGVLLLMVGNGLHSTLLGVRGDLEGFSTFELSIVMSSYFVGFMGASRIVPEMIRRVGHVRVFAALGSFISAVFILFPTFVDPIVWSIGRIIIGFCFCGVYVTAESWLNNSVTNETRGQALSVYMIIQMAGVVAAQWLLSVADPAGFVLFIIISVLVSISFAPILLSISPTPAFEQTKRMKLTDLIKNSPLGCAGMFLLGGVFAAQFGMSAVFGAQINLSLGQISTFVAAFYVGAMLMQYPIGWLSDRMDRRTLIAAVAFIGSMASILAFATGENFFVLLIVAFLIGGMANPLYSLLIAHANDYLDYDDMAACSGGLLFINGLGAIAGPIVIGQVMDGFGPYAFFLIIAALMGLLSLYAVYRMTQRPALDVDEMNAYAPVAPSSSVVVMELAQEYAIDVAMEEESNENAT